MYALVYAPHGIVGEDGSSVRLYESHEKAWTVMDKEARYDPECEDEAYGFYVGDWHATNDTINPDAAEWHIYENEEG